MTKNSANNSNVLQDKKIYNLRNIFDEIVIDLYDVIVFCLLIAMNILEIMECIIFLNCHNTKFFFMKRKRTDENNDNNNMCKDDYFDCNKDRNDLILNIYPLNNYLNLNILQDTSIYNTRNIFLKIMTVYGLYDYYLCINIVFNWNKWIKYKSYVSKDSRESRNNRNDEKKQIISLQVHR